MVTALFSTGNDGKFAETQLALRALAPSLTLLRARSCQQRLLWSLSALAGCDVDPVEVQGSCEEIARAKTEAALSAARSDPGTAALLQTAAVFFTEDVSLHLSCLGGFPGPYVKDFLSAVGECVPGSLASAQLTLFSGTGYTTLCVASTTTEPHASAGWRRRTCATAAA